jgi:lysophospholipase L1-like esterase
MAMVRTNRVFDYLVVALLAALAFTVSPLGLLLIKGDTSLNTRAIAMTLALDAFLLAWIGAIVARGRYRRFFFHLIVWTFPLVVLVGLEALARSIHLAELILPISDESGLRYNGHLPDYFFDEDRSVPANPGWRLYRPRNGDGIFVNDLGLRTAAPTAKSAGEWRVAISGGSSVWGWRVLDADTIPGNVQRLLQHAARKITVYNFGMEGATLEAELLTLQRFREIYDLDEVLFYTGANDVLKAYSSATTGRNELENFVSSGFDLARAARRVNALWQGVDPGYLAKFESGVLPGILQDNPLRRGVMAAKSYCRDAELHCAFALQPMLVTRKRHPAGEGRLARSYELLFPGLATLTRAMYRDAMAAGSDGRVYDLTGMFDDQTKPFFTDHVHLTEDGNRATAEGLVPILLNGAP